MLKPKVNAQLNYYEQRALDTNVSNTGIAAKLPNPQKTYRNSSFAIHLLEHTEFNYSPKKECWVVVLEAKWLHFDLFGALLILRIDNESLQWLFGHYVDKRTTEKITYSKIRFSTIQLTRSKTTKRRCSLASKIK